MKNPTGKQQPVVQPGEFMFAAVALDHGHIYGMCNGLIEAGAQLKSVYDPDPEKLKAFASKFPGVRVALSEEEILNDPEIRLIAGAAVPSKRCDLGMGAMAHGKDYFCDKAPFTTLEQLQKARNMVADTKLKYAVYYGERVHVESAVMAGQLIDQGEIGRVVQVIGLGPHRLSAFPRPDWFFKKEFYGGILCDIGSHQIEQFLTFSGAKDAKVLQSKVGNYKWKEYPEFEDFGDATLIGDNGASNYFRVDWLTPAGLRSWSGDSRMTILGTEGYIEIRKNIDIARSKEPDHLFLVNQNGEQYIHAKGKTGFPFFGQLILDCLHRTEYAMTQEHAFKAAELCLQAQQMAIRVE